MLQTTKEAKGNSDFPLQEQQPIACTNPSLDGDQLFSLSAEELIRYMGYNSWVGTGLGGLENGKSWWLRSVSLVEGGGAGLVDPGGSIKLSDMCNAQGIRPGFNLDKGAVLFMSPAEGGKISTGDAGALTKLTPVSGISQWKLTITDSRHSGFSIEKGEISGNTATVAYSGAATGENEFISAIIKDEYGEITHYGRIAGTPDGDDESGSVSIKLPVGFDSDQDTLYLFSEQYNGDRKTDYASGLKKASCRTNRCRSIWMFCRSRKFHLFRRERGSPGRLWRKAATAEPTATELPLWMLILSASGTVLTGLAAVCMRTRKMQE